MKLLLGSVAGMALLAAAAFGLPAWLPHHHPAGVPPELITSLKAQALTGFSKPALWTDVPNAHVNSASPGGVGGTVTLRTLFGINWASITVYDDGTRGYKYHDERQWLAIAVFAAGELALGGLLVWSVFH